MMMMVAEKMSTVAAAAAVAVKHTAFESEQSKYGSKKKKEVKERAKLLRLPKSNGPVISLICHH